MLKNKCFKLFKETSSLSPLHSNSSKLISDDPETTNSELSKSPKGFLMPSKKNIKSCISQKIPNKIRNEGYSIKIQEFSSIASSYQNVDDST